VQVCCHVWRQQGAGDEGCTITDSLLQKQVTGITISLQVESQQACSVAVCM
jgi:hypothetical protein